MALDNYSILFEKLDAFIRKYYKNQLIKGGIYSFSLLLLLFLSISLLEYIGHFPILARTILFYLYLSFSVFVLVRFIVIPILKLNKLGSFISHEKAAQIIGKHFPEVKDKLLNTIQLKKMTIGQSKDIALINAGIEQKISLLKPIPFNIAINFRENRKYLKFAAVPLLLLLLILVSSPHLITESTTRLINYNRHFEEKAPFVFLVENDSLFAIQQDVYKLRLKIKGTVLPKEVYIVIDGNACRLIKNTKSKFSHIFKNVQKDIRFYFSAGGFSSKEYLLKVFPNPSINNFNVNIIPPKYTSIKEFTLKNTGDLVVPEGSKIIWTFNTEQTKNLLVVLNDSSFSLTKSADNVFQWSHIISDNAVYSVIPKNQYVTNKNAIKYSLNAIHDKYPEITLISDMDSTISTQIYFSGRIKDDYGLSKLQFHYYFIKDGSPDQEHKIDIAFDKFLKDQPYYYGWNLKSLGIKPGDQIAYFFEVWDNDDFHGNKSTKSYKKIFKSPSLKELKLENEITNQEIKDQMKHAIKETKNIQQQLDKMKQKLYEKKTLSWEDKQQIKNLFKKQKEVEKSVENIKQMNFENLKRQDEYQMSSDNIVKKQDQLQKLFDEVMTDEMKKLFRQMEEMLDQLNKEKLQEMINEMKFSNKEIEQELDRSLEIFKQLEFEQELEKTVNELNNLAEKQDSLTNQNSDKNFNQAKSLQKQNELNKEFNEIEDQIDSLEKKNNKLEFPNKLETTDSLQKDVEDEMKKSVENLSQNKNKKATKSQKNAANKMNSLSNKLQSMQSGMEMENRSEDIETLRQLLENLVKLSFNQEDLIKDLKDITTNDLKYTSITKKQRQLKDDASLIEDSLFALSKRNPQIGSVVNREINSINSNMEKAIKNLVERQIAIAKSRQQMVMTSANNLALLLDEILTQLQQQMSEKKFGTASCNKPGNGSSQKISNMKSLQKQLNKQISELKKQQGNNPNGTKPGQKWSKELVKLAAQQEAIRNEIQKLSKTSDQKGYNGSKGNLNDMLKLMEETENDIINNQITRETINRQKDIMIHLLEYEKADRERELDNKRESREVNIENYGNPSDFFEYNRTKMKEIELLNTIPPAFNMFFRTKVNEYFNMFQE